MLIHIRLGQLSAAMPVWEWQPGIFGGAAFRGNDTRLANVLRIQSTEARRNARSAGMPIQQVS
jgi:hypothetical protein